MTIKAYTGGKEFLRGNFNSTKVGAFLSQADTDGNKTIDKKEMSSFLKQTNKISGTNERTAILSNEIKSMQSQIVGKKLNASVIFSLERKAEQSLKQKNKKSSGSKDASVKIVKKKAGFFSKIGPFFSRLFGSKSSGKTNGKRLASASSSATASIREALDNLTMSTYIRSMLTTLNRYEGMEYELYTGADNKTDCYRLPHQVGEEMGATHPLYDFFKYNRTNSGEKNEDKRNIVEYSRYNKRSFPEGIKYNQLKKEDGSLKLKPGCYMVGVRGGSHVVLITAFKSGDYIMTDASSSKKYRKVITRKNEQVDYYFSGSAGKSPLQIIPVNEDAILARNQSLQSIKLV